MHLMPRPRHQHIQPPPAPGTLTDAVNEAGIHKYLSKDWDPARLRS